MRQILDAAYTCFARHGARRTTMDDIAREAGVSRATVYQHVKNKDDAFRRLVERMFAAATQQARAAAQAEADLDEKLASVLAAKLGLTLMVWRDSPAHAMELLGDNTRLSADLSVEFTATLHDLLVAAIRAEYPDREPGEMPELLLSLTRGLEAHTPDQDDAVRRLREGIRLIVAGWRATAEPGSSAAAATRRRRRPSS